MAVIKINHKPRLRRGITLIEVLISMGILTLGLLGVAALFPVGSYYMQRGEVYDRADAAAQAAFNDAVTRGLLDPERWVAFNHTDGGGPSSFTKQFTDDLRQRLRLREDDIASAGGGREAHAGHGQRLNVNVGFAYVIDPYAVAAAESHPPTAPTDPTVGYRMQGVPSALQYRNMSLAGDPSSMLATWYPWIPSGQMVSGASPLPLSEYLWPVRRLSIATQPSFAPFSPWRMDAETANTLMSLTDDLAAERPDDGERPAQQLMATADGDALARMSRREFSYLLTVVPHNLAARDALAYGGAGQQYDVSAVVFHRRVTGGEYDGDSGNMSQTFNGHQDTVLNERIARAAIQTSAPSGGVIRLSSDPGASAIGMVENFFVSQEESRFENLKTGEYLMLLGPHPSSTSARPILFLQWYRVLSVDPVKDSSGMVQLNNLTGEPQYVDVALRGPDWPWQATDPIASDLRAVIMPGAVAVHTRTMRLDAGVTWAGE